NLTLNRRYLLPVIGAIWCLSDEPNFRARLLALRARLPQQGVGILFFFLFPGFHPGLLSFHASGVLPRRRAGRVSRYAWALRPGSLEKRSRGHLYPTTHKKRVCVGDPRAAVPFISF